MIQPVKIRSAGRSWISSIQILDCLRRKMTDEFWACISRLKEIIETATQKAKGKGSVKIRPIFRVEPEDENLLERSENG